MPIIRRNIGRRQASFLSVFKNLAGFGARTENPRVGGSIPSGSVASREFGAERARRRTEDRQATHRKRLI